MIADVIEIINIQIRPLRMS